MVSPTPYADSEPAPIALSQDIYLSPYSKAYIRLYVPVSPPKNRKLPLIIYLHGGDFVLFSASTFLFHNFCNDIASQFPAVVASVEFRLAPENRLPAAYDDALNAIFWAKNQALGIGGRDPWMEYADFSRVFLLGSGAGGNIVYHAALRALDFDIRPLKIKGLLMNQAYFGGLERTQSEIRLKDDPYVALYVNDGVMDPGVAQEPEPGSRVLQPDFRRDSCRVPVYYRFNEGGFHGMELLNQTAAQQLYNDMKAFVNDVHANLNSEDISHHHATATATATY
ncbi:UNVERIFIED_CONTAM: putative carboxylesterase 8 [Sesamum angustifolium]|uniref:Carboxylesterase 8 n=1 Tax=Sesamum angustifolium TaxID=2727405 RepID=A0AAW2JAZ4_9LAMI